MEWLWLSGEGTEVAETCVTLLDTNLGWFEITQTHSTRAVTHVTGYFSDLRPQVGTYDLWSYGGKQ